MDSKAILVAATADAVNSVAEQPKDAWGKELGAAHIRAAQVPGCEL